MVKSRSGYFETSWLFFLAALKFFRFNLDLLWIPVLGCLVQIGLVGVFLSVGIFFFISYFEVGSWWATHSSASVFLGVCWCIFFFFLINVVGVFSSAILLASCMKRLRGEKGKKREAFILVWNRKSPLLVWALMLTVFGLIVDLLERSHRIIAYIVQTLLNGSFSLGAYFGLPVLLFRGEGPIQSLLTGIRFFGQGWRKTVSVVFLLAIPSLVILFVLYVVLIPFEQHVSGSFFIALIICIVLFSFLATTLGAVVRGALFIGLFEKGPVKGFDSELLEQGITQRNMSMRR